MGNGWWWSTPLIPALRNQRQEVLCEFEANLVFRVSSRTGRATKRNPVWKNQTKPNQKIPVMMMMKVE